jgi:repressor LexA
MRQLTPRQRAILDFIIRSIGEHDRFPSYREIGRKFGLASSATVSQHLDALTKKGFLIKAGKRLMLSGDHRPARGVPIVGRVAAGLPITAVENRDGRLDVSTLFRDDATYFAVQVTGDSMRDVGLLDGDYVVVRQQEDAEDGDIVVAYLDDEATVKVLRKQGRTIELEPRNAAYASISIASKRQNLRIGGKVVGMMRKIK